MHLRVKMTRIFARNWMVSYIYKINAVKINIRCRKVGKLNIHIRFSISATGCYHMIEGKRRQKTSRIIIAGAALH